MDPLYKIAFENGGRPPTYKKVGDLKGRCIEYFEYVKETKEPITITGLSIFLGFGSRQSIYDYIKNERRKEFSYIVKKAVALVENAYELRCNEDYPTGAIFVLKNMKWSDSMKHLGADDDEEPLKVNLGGTTFNL